MTEANKWPTDSIRETDASREVWEKFVRFKWMMREEVWMDPGKFQCITNKGISDAGSTADFRILFEIFEILENSYFF